MVKFTDDSSFLKLHPWRGTSLSLAKPLMHIGFLSRDQGEMGCYQGNREESMVKVAPASDDSSSAQLHPWPRPWTTSLSRGLYKMRTSPRILSSWFTWIPSEEPSVELGSTSELLLSSEYSDGIRSRSMVRTSLIKNIYQNLIITWLSRLRQEGEFTITSKSTFQRRITSNHHWLPIQLLYYRYLFHISCHSNYCICILFWNTYIHNRTCSWLPEPSVELIEQSLIVEPLNQWCEPTFWNNSRTVL